MSTAAGLEILLPETPSPADMPATTRSRAAGAATPARVRGGRDGPAARTPSNTPTRRVTSATSRRSTRNSHVFTFAEMGSPSRASRASSAPEGGFSSDDERAPRQQSFSSQTPGARVDGVEAAGDGQWDGGRDTFLGRASEHDMFVSGSPDDMPGGRDGEGEQSGGEGGTWTMMSTRAESPTLRQRTNILSPEGGVASGMMAAAAAAVAAVASEEKGGGEPPSPAGDNARGSSGRRGSITTASLRKSMSASVSKFVTTQREVALNSTAPWYVDMALQGLFCGQIALLLNDALENLVRAKSARQPLLLFLAMVALALALRTTDTIKGRWNPLHVFTMSYDKLKGLEVSVIHPWFMSVLTWSLLFANIIGYGIGIQLFALIVQVVKDSTIGRVLPKILLPQMSLDRPPAQSFAIMWPMAIFAVALHLYLGPARQYNTHGQHAVITRIWRAVDWCSPTGLHPHPAVEAPTPKTAFRAARALSFLALASIPAVWYLYVTCNEVQLQSVSSGFWIAAGSLWLYGEAMWLSVRSYKALRSFARNLGLAGIIDANANAISILAKTAAGFCNTWFILMFCGLYPLLWYVTLMAVLAELSVPYVLDLDSLLNINLWKKHVTPGRPRRASAIYSPRDSVFLTASPFPAHPGASHSDGSQTAEEHTALWRKEGRTLLLVVTMCFLVFSDPIGMLLSAVTISVRRLMRMFGSFKAIVLLLVLANLAVRGVNVIWLTSPSPCPEMKLAQDVVPDMTGFVFPVEDISKGLGRSHKDRTQYARQIGCLTSTVTVMTEVPPQYRYGLFGKENRGRTFPALIRLSGDERDSDTSFEPRGMSIKIAHVHGTEIGHDKPSDDVVQDISLMSADMFVAPNPKFYPSLMALRGTKGSLSAWALGLHLQDKSTAGPRPAWWDPRTWQLSVLKTAWKIAHTTSKMDMPLDWSYSSTVPFRCGPEAAIKFHVRPCPGEFARSKALFQNVRLQQPESFLTRNLHDHLSRGSACLELLIQPQLDACMENIDDPSQPWTTKLIKVAEINVPRQVFLRRDQGDACKTSSFQPWQGLKDHQPLGTHNHLRRVAYETAAKYRQVVNYEIPREWTNDTFKGDTLMTSDTACPTCCDSDLCKYERYEAPFDDLPARALASSLYSMSGLFEFEKYRRLMEWIPQQTILSGVGAGIASQLRYWLFIPIREDWLTFLPGDYNDLLVDTSNHRPLLQHWNNLPMLDKSRNEAFMEQDWVFAYQFLAGLNPMMIVKAKAATRRPLPAEERRDESIRLLPADLNVTAANRYLESMGTSLERLIAQDRLLFVDFHVLEDTPFKPGVVLYKPIALFGIMAFDREGEEQRQRVVPLAIQLTRSANAPNKLYTPASPAAVWKFAKLQVLHSDSVVHESVVHLGYTHLASEPILIAFQRRLPTNHTFMRMMKKHFKDTFGINELGRRTLVSKEGQFERITGAGLKGTLSVMESSYRFHSLLRRDAGWNLRDFNFVDNMQLRGFSREDNVPFFFFRDDGYKIWDMLEIYVSIHIANSYPQCEQLLDLLVGRDGLTDGDTCNVDQSDAQRFCDRDIQTDSFLQELHVELEHDDLANLPDPVPHFYESWHDLVRFLTSIVFQTTAQHSAVNNGQYHWYGFVPGRPMQLHREMPHDESRVDEAYIRGALPTMENAEATVNIVHVITMKPSCTLDEALTETASDKTLPSDRAKKLLGRKLKELKQTIEARNDKARKDNEEITIPYQYLHPATVSASVAI